MILVKLGGSLLTDKSSYRTPRPDAIARLAREVAGAAEPVVLVHGAGSYGHVLAREHDLAHGVRTSEARAAFARVRADVAALNALVGAVLIEAEASPVTVPPFAIALLHDGELTRFECAPVQRALDAGFLPVLHGDGVLDAKRGGGIVSGDEVMAVLARDLKPRLAVFATDVGGIYRGTPGSADADLIERVSAADLEEMAFGGSAHPDVTGGMAGKARRILAITREGVPVRVVNGNVPGRVAAALANTQVPSTEVIP